MSLLFRSTLLSAIFAGFLTAVPSTVYAQEPDGEEGVDLGGDDDDDDDDDAAEEPKPEPEPPPEMEGNWGEGGGDEEGKYRPRGKTGKLKELDSEVEEEEKEEAEGPPDLPPPGFVYLDTALGFGDVTIAEYTTGATNVTPTASFVVGLGYRIGDVWQVYARFPISTNMSDGPENPFVEGARNPDTFTQIAVGAFELGVKPHFILSRDLRLPVGLAIAFPSGQGDMFAGPDDQADLGKRIVNVAAAASRGWEDRGLFASKRLTLTPSGGVLYQIPDLGPGKLRLGADTKVEIMIKTGGAKPEELERLANEAQGELNSVAINWTLGGHVFYDFFDGMLSPGLKMWLAVSTPEESRGNGIDSAGTQFVFEPNIATHIPFLEDDAFRYRRACRLHASRGRPARQQQLPQRCDRWFATDRRLLLLASCPRSAAVISVLRFVIDARYVRDRPSGIGMYVRELVDRMPAIAPDVQFRFWTHPERPRISASDNVSHHTVRATGDGFRTMFAPSLLDSLAGDDVVHFPFNLLGRGIRCASVVTIHDLMWLEQPELVDGRPFVRRVRQRYYQAGMRNAMRSATKLICVSQATADRVIAVTPAAKDRIVVTHNAVSDAFRPPRNRDTSRQNAATVVGSSDPYFLVVGKNEPYKAHDVAVRAFAAARKGRERFGAGAAGPRGARHQSPRARTEHRRPRDLVAQPFSSRARRRHPQRARAHSAVDRRGLWHPGARGDGLWLSGHHERYGRARRGRRRRWPACAHR